MSTEPTNAARASELPTPFKPPYRFEMSEHGPVTIYDAIDVGWIARVKESLPHKEALAAAMVAGLNAAARGVDSDPGSRASGEGNESGPRAAPKTAPGGLGPEGRRPASAGGSSSAAHQRELRPMTTPHPGEEPAPEDFKTGQEYHAAYTAWLARWQPWMRERKERGYV